MNFEFERRRVPPRMKGSQILNKAKKAKYDEFYSTYGEVDAELSLYPEQIAGLDVFLPFDGPDSAFTHWFLDHPELGCRVRRTESLFPSAAWDEAFSWVRTRHHQPPLLAVHPVLQAARGGRRAVSGDVPAYGGVLC